MVHSAHPCSSVVINCNQLTCHGRKSFMKMAPKTTLKSGSSDLTTLTNASEPAPSDITVTHWPRPWMMPMGTMSFACEFRRERRRRERQSRGGRQGRQHARARRSRRSEGRSRRSHVLRRDLGHLAQTEQPERRDPEHQAEAELQRRDDPREGQIFKHRLVVVIVRHVDHVPDEEANQNWRMERERSECAAKKRA